MTDKRRCGMPGLWVPLLCNPTILKLVSPARPCSPPLEGVDIDWATQSGGLAAILATRDTTMSPRSLWFVVSYFQNIAGNFIPMPGVSMVFLYTCMYQSRRFRHGGETAVLIDGSPITKADLILYCVVPTLSTSRTILSASCA